MMVKSNWLQEVKENCQNLLQWLEVCENQPERICLQEIQAIIQNDETDDFEAIENIITSLNKYGWKTGNRHDFG